MESWAAHENNDVDDDDDEDDRQRFRPVRSSVHLFEGNIDCNNKYIADGSKVVFM